MSAGTEGGRQPTDVAHAALLGAIVRIETKDGPRDAHAQHSPAAPGLAVTMYPFGLFKVTHVASGYGMGGGYERAASALLVLAQFAAIGAKYGVDFTAPGPAVTKALRGCGAQPVPFNGATTSDSAGTRPCTVNEWLAVIRSEVPSDEFPWESPDEHPGDRALALLDTLAAQEAPHA